MATLLYRSCGLGQPHDVAATRASTLLTYCHGRAATYARPVRRTSERRKGRGREEEKENKRPGCKTAITTCMQRK
jgi:hypothetical protein